MATAAARLEQRQVAKIGDVVEFPGSDSSANDIRWLNLHKINLLEQVRKTYEEIVTLADDFTGKGMMHPVQVALYTPAKAQAYLDMENSVWGTNYTLADLRVYSWRPRRYAILFTGHRRMLAHLHLWFQGCSDCFARYGREEAGACYRRHPRLRFGEVQAKVYRQITPSEAAEFQCSENLHKTVPADEQADAYERLFVVRSLRDPQLSVAEFARQVGCDADTVRRARRYCRLPQQIRCDVEQRRYSYGVALELGRMRERLALSDRVLAGERERVISQRLTVKQVRKTADELIRRAETGEDALFGIGVLATGERQHRRSVFERKTVQALYGYRAYLRQVKPLLADGSMGPNGRYLDTSTRRVAMDTVEALEAILPDLRVRLGEAEAARADAVLAEVRETVMAIDALEEPPLGSAETIFA